FAAHGASCSAGGRVRVTWVRARRPSRRALTPILKVHSRPVGYSRPLALAATPSRSPGRPARLALRPKSHGPCRAVAVNWQVAGGGLMRDLALWKSLPAALAQRAFAIAGAAARALKPGGRNRFY